MNEPTGLVPRIMAHLFGERVGRLTERGAPSHWLSYVLILSQSAAVLLVFGHAELPLLWSSSWAVRAIATMGLFVLLATVFAADMAMLASMKRIPVLARNRQRWALREHMAYVLFVLVTEAITLGVVLSTLDADPLRLISAQPLIPPQGGMFHAQIVLRVTLVSWSAIQLVIVRGKLPVLLSTLTATGRELVGAHVERRLARLDIGDINLPAAFRTYAAMSKPPRRIRTFWNGWLADREVAMEAEEQRQVDNVVDALEELERRHTREVVAEASPALPQPTYTPPLEAQTTPYNDPNPDDDGPGGGTPLPARAPRPLHDPLVPVEPVKLPASARNGSGLVARQGSKPETWNWEQLRDYVARTYDAQLSRTEALAIIKSCGDDARREGGPGRNGRPLVAPRKQLEQRVRLALGIRGAGAPKQRRGEREELSA